MKATAESRKRIPKTVWELGFVSLFMDTSSEMIHSLLPLFLRSVLGASATAVGALEGTAESAVLVAKMFSGALSDWLGKRKSLTLAGYGLAALTKPLFPIAGSYPVVFAARLMDRIGKGIRGAPRDALIADVTPSELRGASFGLRQALDTVGAFCGPLAATVLMLRSSGNFRLVFWIAVLPAVLAVAILAIFVREPLRSTVKRDTRPGFQWRDLRGFPAAFWWVSGIGSILTLARFSDAFLVLRSSQLGIRDAMVPMVMVVMNIVYAIAAYPAGRLSDRMDRRVVLIVSVLILVAADIVLARAGGTAGLIAGVMLWGLHMGFSQGLLTAMVTDASSSDRRGTAFGLFSLLTGVALLTASVLAGELWDRIGAPATFYAGAGFAAIAMLGLLAQLLIPTKKGSVTSHG